MTFGDLIEFLQERLHELRTFYRLIEQVGAKKFAVAIQKYGQPPPRKPETYYISPDVYKIQKPLDLFTIMHNYCLQKIKNFLSVSCAIKDTVRHELEDGKVIINDFRVKFGSRKTYVEYTSGGRAAMRKVIQKIAENRNSETVLLVGLEELPRRRQSGIYVQSNRQEALELAADLGVKV